MTIGQRAGPDGEHREQVLARIAAAYRHEAVDRPPVLIGDANYWITGEDPDLIPSDYFEEGAYRLHAGLPGGQDRSPPRAHAR